MKKLFTLSVLALTLFAGSFSSFAQTEVNSMEEVFQVAEKKANVVAEKIGLNDDEKLLLVRQIVSREQMIAKVEVNKNNPSNTNQDLDKYVTQANEQFKKNVMDLFGESRAKKILSLYEVKD
jgi:GTPase involved in cell partitioning and DNA repair